MRLLSLAQFSTCCWVVQNMSVLLQVYFEYLMVALKGRAVLKIGMQYGKLITDATLKVSKAKKQFRDCCQYSPLVRSRLHRSFAT